MSQAVEPRRGWPLTVKIVLFLLALVLLVLTGAWLQRKPIAADILGREISARGVTASYRITRLGFRNQRLENIVIGDPANPDLTADWAEVLVSLRWGGVTVRKITARGVRLNGRIVGGKLRLGQIDRLLLPPSGKPFAFPDFEVDIDRTRISLATSAGRVSLALRGRGKLSDGFRGRLAGSAPRIALGAGCRGTGVRANVALTIDRRSPHISGPVSAALVDCPASEIRAARLSIVVDARLPEALNRWRGGARLGIETLEVARGAASGLAGNVRFDGDADLTLGVLDVIAQRARFAEHSGRRLRFDGRYRVQPRQARIALLGDVALGDLALGRAIRAALTTTLLSAAGTPIEPLGRAAASAVQRATQSIDLLGSLKLVHGPRGGGARLQPLTARSASGARLAVAGGEGLTYYWPQRLLRIDGEASLQGGDFPIARIAFDQPRPGGPISGVLRVAPYAAGGARLALAPVRFSAGGGASTRIDTVVTLDGAFNDGRVEGLTVPVAGQLDGGGGFAFNKGCVTASWRFFKAAGLRLGPARIPLCPTGPGLVYRQGSGPVLGGAEVRGPRFAGQLGQTPIAMAAANAHFTLGSPEFSARDVAVRLGTAASLSELDLATLDGRFSLRGAGGTFTGARGDIGNVPLLLSGGKGDWQVVDGKVLVTGGLTIADAAPLPRFYPLRADAVRLTLIDNQIAASAVLNDPETGTKVSDLSIAHNLRDGTGGAVVDVPAIRFDRSFQPEELTRLTTGVVALVDGVVTGRGNIRWNRDGVTSDGRFSTDDLDLAAAFGPVTGIKGTIEFNDLLGLQTAPGQSIDIAEINPGILVQDGKLSYQLLPGQRVRIEGARWPYAGGELLLEETILELGKPAAKKLTFRIVGMDAALFVQQFEFENIAATGTFDGVIPMIFDERGGRIVGGSLTSREGGGTLAYVGVLSDKALGTYGKLAFDALKSLRYTSMSVYLDGELDGEFLSRFTINGRNQSEKATGILKQITGLPFKFNIAIRGQFRALLATARSFNDPRDLIKQSLPVPIEGLPGTDPTVQTPESEKRP